MSGKKRPQTAFTPPRTAYPPTFVRPASDGPPRAEVYDPALQQYARAFRAGEPDFDLPSLDRAWHAARRAAMDHALAVIAAHPLGSTLTLRGSRVMRAWFGDGAREPGDLDYVAPARWRYDGAEAMGLRDDLSAVFAGRARVVNERLAFTGEVLHAELWTYDRVPGYRLVLPWKTPGVPDGEVQMDFVFHEEMPVDPEPVTLALEPAGAPLTALCASRALSLAWKLSWLLSDPAPQGKDLYDAVLLAESTALPEALYDVVFDQVSAFHLQSLAPRLAPLEKIVALLEQSREMGLVDWDNYVLELGRRGAKLGSANAWFDRLIAALQRG